MFLAGAVHAFHLRLARRSWNKWHYRHQLKQREEDQLQSAYHLAQLSLQRMAFGRWKTCILTPFTHSLKPCKCNLNLIKFL